MEGKKYDSGKPRYDLIPPVVLDQLAQVLTYGSHKYGDNNWQNVKPFNDRYYAAAMRHLQADRAGEVHDPESGLPHLTHALASVAFLLWHQLSVVPTSRAVGPGPTMAMPEEHGEVDDMVATRRDYYKALFVHQRPLHDFLLRTAHIGRFMDAVVTELTFDEWLRALDTPDAANVINSVPVIEREFLTNLQEAWDEQALTARKQHKPCDPFVPDVFGEAADLLQVLFPGYTIVRIK